MADTLAINGTTIGLESTAAPSGGYGTVYVVALDWGIPDVETFLDPVPLGDGMAFRGQVAKDRKFTIVIAGEPGSRAKGQDTWEALQTLFRSPTGPLSYKYTRTDGTGATIIRELLAIPLGEPGYGEVRGGDGAGIRPNGNFRFVANCEAPFPWWRKFAEVDSSIACTAATPNNVVITRGGRGDCGLQVKVSTSGALSSITLSDGNRSMVLTATFSGTPKGVDWRYTDPLATSIDSGVTISIPAHLSLHSASTTITAAPNIGATGTHTVAIKHKALYGTP